MPRGLHLLLCLAALLAVLPTPSRSQSCNTTLVRQANLPSATCFDGSPATYYVSPPVGPNLGLFVVWLGEGSMCGSAAQCQTTCPVANASCQSSTALPATLQGLTALCDGDAHFGAYTRVYVPPCSQDWFLGRSGAWQGAAILDQVFAAVNFAGAQRVVIGGIGGAAIGALNSVRRLRAGPLALVPNVLIVADSAGEVAMERFGPYTPLVKYDSELQTNTSGWLSSSAMDPQCTLFFPATETYRCLVAYEVIRRSLQNERVFVMQAQYDLTVLRDLDLLDDSFYTRYVDNVSYGQGAVNFIESYGANVRREIEWTAYIGSGALAHYYFSPACGQHGFIVPTNAQLYASMSAVLGQAGTLTTATSVDAWTTINMGGLSARAALVQWTASEGMTDPIGSNAAAEVAFAQRNGVRADRCASFHCNPSCPETIDTYTLAYVWQPCSQRLIVVFCVLLIAFFWLVFAVAGVAICAFRTRTNHYWASQLESEKQERQTLGSAEAENKFRQEATDAMVRDAHAGNRKVHLMVRRLSYWAPVRHRSQTPHQILRDVTATFPSGQMHALMGPSGSGKTTMLDMVALTRDTGIMTGTHYVNGVQSHSRMASFLRDWLQHNVSYVRQQDNLFPLLTVREHLTHAAWLMLPEFMSLEEKLERVNQVVKIMELDRAADTICGDGGVAVEGGISGGQRRRVSVATQLLRLPAALILDEPTSGLDSTNAFLLVKSLNMLAHQGGVNVIMTIHQPRREIYRYLDTLKILVAGRLIFQGAPKEAFDHFGVSARLNIGDEILDQLAKSQLEEIVAFQRKYEQGPLGQAVQRDMINEVSLEFDWSMAELIRQTLVANALAEGRWTWTESSSAPTLMYVLMSRTMKRGGFDVAKTIMISLFGGILVGIVFVGQITYTRKTALAYLSVATMTFLQGTFIGDRYWAEKFMYESEAEAGTARPWISFLGSMYARLFVSSTVESLAFAVPVYYLGFQHPDRVLMYLLIMTMVAVTTATQYLLVEIYFMKPDDKRTGALVNIALLSMSALFNGFIIQLKDLPVYLAWLPTVMLSYWGFVAILINDLRLFTLPCSASELECAARTGDNLIRTLRYDNRDVYMCLFALYAMTIICVVLGFAVFFVKYVQKLGAGLKHKTSPELEKDMQDFIVEAKKLQEADVESTMDLVIKAGKTARQGMQRADSAGGAGGGLTRNNSMGSEPLGRNDSVGSDSTDGKTLQRGDSDSSLKGARMVIKPPPGVKLPDGFEDDVNPNTLMSPMVGGKQIIDTVEDEMNALDNDYEGQTGGRRCFHHDTLLVRFWISRMALVMVFFVDYFAAWLICYGQDASFESALTGPGAGTLDPAKVQEAFAQGGGAPTPFVVVNVLFFVFYAMQFLVQLFFLFPRGINGELRWCTRVALLDLAGAFFLTIDLILIFLLWNASAKVYVLFHIWIMVVIRIVRILRVSTFWFKIDAFHMLRAKVYLSLKKQAMEEYDPAAYVEPEDLDAGLEPAPLIDEPDEPPAPPPVPVRGGALGRIVQSIRAQALPDAAKRISVRRSMNRGAAPVAPQMPQFLAQGRAPPPQRPGAPALAGAGSPPPARPARPDRPLVLPASMRVGAAPVPVRQFPMDASGPHANVRRSQRQGASGKTTNDQPMTEFNKFFPAPGVKPNVPPRANRTLQGFGVQGPGAFGMPPQPPSRPTPPQVPVPPKMRSAADDSSSKPSASRPAWTPTDDEI